MYVWSGIIISLWKIVYPNKRNLITGTATMKRWARNWWLMIGSKCKCWRSMDKAKKLKKTTLHKLIEKYVSLLNGRKKKASSNPWITKDTRRSMNSRNMDWKKYRECKTDTKWSKQEGQGRSVGVQEENFDFWGHLTGIQKDFMGIFGRTRLPKNGYTRL